jgi:hypothetical protein
MIYVPNVCYDFMMQYTKEKDTKITPNLPRGKPIYSSLTIKTQHHLLYHYETPYLPHTYVFGKNLKIIID